MEALVDTNRLKKIILAKKVGQFLEKDRKRDERAAVEGVARMLAEDISRHVRGTLAFSLRQTKHLPADIAERIARDSEDISCPFLAETTAFTDQQLAKLVPTLEEFARITVARRKDVGALTAVSIAASGDEPSVTFLLKNDDVKISERSAQAVAKRFVKNQALLDILAAREDLPISVARDIINKVSDTLRDRLITTYKIAPKVAELVTGTSQKEALWQRLQGSSRSKIHGLAVDLRRDNQLDMAEVLEMAERGCLAFLESGLAVSAALTVAEVREALSLKSKETFVAMLKRAGVPSAVAPGILKLAHKRYRE